MARELGISRRTVIRAISTLKELGEIAVSPRTILKDDGQIIRIPNKYTVTLDAKSSSKQAFPVSANLTPSEDKLAPSEDKLAPMNSTLEKYIEQFI